MIFRDPDQIKKNLDGKNVPAKKKDLELGRFTRFITGISPRIGIVFSMERTVTLRIILWIRMITGISRCQVRRMLEG